MPPSLLPLPRSLFERELVRLQPPAPPLSRPARSPARGRPGSGFSAPVAAASASRAAPAVPATQLSQEQAFAVIAVMCAVLLLGFSPTTHAMGNFVLALVTIVGVAVIIVGHHFAAVQCAPLPRVELDATVEMPPALVRQPSSLAARRQNHEESPRSRAIRIFSKVDVNDDGIVTQAELKAHLATHEAMGFKSLDDETTAKMFSALDVNHDGTVSLEEWVAVIARAAVAPEFKEPLASPAPPPPRSLPPLASSGSREEREDAARRAVYLRRVPPEPLEGAANKTRLCVHTPAGSRVWRHFESSDTLEDLANFARSLPGVPLGSSLRLSNVTMAPHQPLNLETQIGLTLYTLDMWPTAHVQVSDADAAPADAQRSTLSAERGAYGASTSRTASPSGRSRSET